MVLPLISFLTVFPFLFQSLGDWYVVARLAGNDDGVTSGRIRVEKVDDHIRGLYTAAV